MAQITLNSTGVASNGALVLQSNGTTTAVTISTAQVATLEKDAVVNGLTVGRGAGAVSTNTAVGASALAANTSGANNTAVGQVALDENTTGSVNVAFGVNTLGLNTTGSENSAIGVSSLSANTTGSYNTALGRYALASNTTASNNTVVGSYAGYNVTTGAGNTFVGTLGLAGSAGCGYYMTTGNNNTIIGGYTGNQNGLDIRTASNYIVLSDGAGTPRYWFNGTATNNYLGNTVSVINEYRNTVDGLMAAFSIGASYDAASVGDMIIKKYTQTGYASPRIYIVSSTNGVYLAVNGTSWASASDERMKDIIEPITDAANKVSTLRAVIGKYKTDEEGTRRSFLIAQDIQAVLPEAVDATDLEKLGVQYTDVIPLLVAAIKELKAEIDILKGQA